MKAVGESGGYGMLIGPAVGQADDRGVPRSACKPTRAITSRSRWSDSRACPSTIRAAGRMAGRHVDLRPYCLYDGEKVTIVPGGLTRVALASRIAGGEFIAGRRQQGHLGAAGDDMMLSRIADSLFWIARYMERAEDTARILDVNYHMLLEQSQQPYRLRWEPLVVISRRAGAVLRDATRRPSAQNVFEFLGLPRGQSQLDRAAASARRARTPAPSATGSRARCGRTSTASTSRSAGSSRTTRLPIGPHRFCNVIKFGGHRFHGVTDATLPHDEGWHFLHAGRGARARGDDGAHRRRAVPQAGGRAAAWRPARQPSVDGGAQIGRRLRGLPPAVPLPHRAGTGGGAADPASRSTRGRSASASTELQRSLRAISGCRSGRLRQRGRAADRQAARSPHVRPHRGHLRARPAPVPDRAAEHLPPRSASTSRAAYFYYAVAWHESLPSPARHRVPVRRAGLRELQRGPAAPACRTSGRAACRSA